MLKDSFRYGSTTPALVLKLAANMSKLEGIRAAGLAGGSWVWPWEAAAASAWLDCRNLFS
jgi:hypothetical protein